jgi:hypothetical protein
MGNLLKEKSSDDLLGEFEFLNFTDVGCDGLLDFDVCKLDEAMPRFLCQVSGAGVFTRHEDRAMCLHYWGFLRLGLGLFPSLQSTCRPVVPTYRSPVPVDQQYQHTGPL